MKPKELPQDPAADFRRKARTHFVRRFGEEPFIKLRLVMFFTEHRRRIHAGEITQGGW